MQSSRPAASSTRSPSETWSRSRSSTPSPAPKVSLPVALVVDGAKVTTDAKDLEKVAVTGEVLEHTKGPKIRIHKFKNKTGYHKRQGHRQQLTVLKVTGIK